MRKLIVPKSAVPNDTLKDVGIGRLLDAEKSLEPVKVKELKKLVLPPPSQLYWAIDPIQQYLNALKMQKLPIFAEAMNRNMTGLFFKFIDYKVEKKENISLEWKGQTRCQPAETFMQVSNLEGVVDRKLGELKDMFKVLSFNFSKNMVEVKDAQRFDSGMRKIFEVRTLGGRTIKATASHRFFVKRNGKVYEEAVRNIKIGDEIVTIEQ